MTLNCILSYRPGDRTEPSKHTILVLKTEGPRQVVRYLHEGSISSYVKIHPDTNAQAQRLAAVLTAAEVPVKLVGGKNTNHSKLNNDLGVTDDPNTAALYAFVDELLK